VAHIYVLLEACCAMKLLCEYSDARLKKLDKLDDIQNAVMQRIHDRANERVPMKTDQERRVDVEEDKGLDNLRLLDVVKPGLVITRKKSKKDFTIVSINDKITTLEDADGNERNVMTKHLARDFFIN